MAHLGCKCGESMWNGMVPNDIVYQVFSDRRVCEIDEMDNFDRMDLWDMCTHEVWRCPACGRLYVFEADSNTAIAVYRLEPSEPEDGEEAN